MLAMQQKEPSLRVIVVDGDEAVRNSLKFALEIEGFEVRVYSGGTELMESAEVKDCACLVIDQNMSAMSGLETVRRLRARNIAVPAILMASHPSAMLRASAKSAGIRVVEKPLLGNTLVEGIRGMLGH